MNVTDWAHARLKQILRQAMPLEPVLPDDVVRSLRKLTREAKKELS